MKNWYPVLGLAFLHHRKEQWTHPSAFPAAIHVNDSASTTTNALADKKMYFKLVSHLLFPLLRHFILRFLRKYRMQKRKEGRFWKSNIKVDLCEKNNIKWNSSKAFQILTIPLFQLRFCSLRRVLLANEVTTLGAWNLKDIIFSSSSCPSNGCLYPNDSSELPPALFLPLLRPNASETAGRSPDGVRYGGRSSSINHQRLIRWAAAAAELYDENEWTKKPIETNK